MKKFFWIGAVGVFLFFYFFSIALASDCVTSSARGKVFLNEVSSASAYDDWVEVYNLFDQCLDLSGFSIWDSGSSIKTFSTGTTLGSGNYLLVDLNNRLNKTTDSVVLKYGEDEWDRFDYGGGAVHTYADEGYVWARVPNGGEWALTSTPTPGATNPELIIDPVVSTTTPTSTEIILPTSTPTTTSITTTPVFDLSGLRLNEIYPDSENGNEWVELFNLNTTTEFSNLKVCDNRLTVCRMASGTIQQAGWFLFDLGSGFLNNTGDSAILKDGADNILDRIDFEIIGRGRSYARSVDGGGVWAITTKITPNATNAIVTPVVSGGSAGVSHSNTAYNTQNTDIKKAIVTSSLSGKIILNEIFPDPDGSDAVDEFIEIKNISTEEINLSGWSIGDRDKKYFISGSIMPGGFLFWRRITTGIVLNNTTAEEVFLYDKDGNFVDRIKYDKAETGLSFSRFSNDWQWTSSLTSGQENIFEESDAVAIIWKIKYPANGSPNEVLLFSAEESADPRGGDLSYQWDFGDGILYSGEEAGYSFSTSGTYVVNILASSTAGTIGKKQVKVTIGDSFSSRVSPIFISEVMFDPAGADNQEFIELWNNGSSTIDLSGWQIRFGDKKYQIPDSTSILADGNLVFYRAATKIVLTNSGGKIELVAPGGDVIDLVKYGKGISGKSYSLVDDEWLMADPTPGKIGKGGVKKDSISSGAVGGKNIWFRRFNIEEARAQDKGVYVLVRGTVAALPGVFGSQYFYISDGVSGIAVYQYKKDFPPLEVGDVIEVSGIISEANSQKRINIKQASAINILKIEQTMVPSEVSLVTLDDTPIGSFVKISGDITEKKSGYWYVDDGEAEVIVYLKQGAKIDASKFQEGQKVEVIGVLEQGKNGLQIWPRSTEDIKIIGMAQELAKPVVAEGRSMYVSAAIGAATTLVLGFLARARGAIMLVWLGRGIRAIASIIRRG